MISQSLKSNMGKEMNSIATKTAHVVSEVYPSSNANALKELFCAVIQQLRHIVHAHTVVLDSVKSNLNGQQYNSDIVLYTKEDVWSQVHTVVS